MNKLGRKLCIIFLIGFILFIGIYLIYETDVTVASPYELLKNWSQAVRLSSVSKNFTPSLLVLPKLNRSYTESIFHYNFNYILSVKAVCTKSLQLLIVIPSSASNFEQRLAIRQTWGSVSVTNDVVKVIFFLASPSSASVQEDVKKEHLSYNDIVQIDLHESYRNLTLKTIMMVKWVSSFCSRAPLVLKADDDVFVNIPKLFSLSLISENNATLFGTLVKAGSKPVRSKSSKFYVSTKEYPFSKFPAYLGGPAYLIIGRAVSLLNAATTKVKPIAMEDVYLTGLCTQFVGLELKNEPLIDTIPHRPLKPCRICDYAVAHEITPSDMYVIFSKLLSSCNCNFHNVEH